VTEQNQTQTQTRTTLKRKLLKIVLGVLILVAMSILGLVSWLNMRTEQVRLANVEHQVRTSIESKARLIVDNHAMALRGLVADNVFSDVKDLVERAVAEDSDIIYGLFIDATGTPWAYASPSTLSSDGDAKVKLEKWTELGLSKNDANVTAAIELSKDRFSQGIFEVARPVYVDKELLGTVRYGFTTEPLKMALHQARAESQATLFTLLKMIAVAVFITTLIGFVWVNNAATHIVQPLMEVKRATDRIAAGETGVRVQVDSDDEVQALATAFNDMQQANEDAMRRLSDAMEGALEASRLKSEFLANMSHEIRTPMNGVIGMIRLILKMPLEGKMRRYAETVDASASALMTIINDILDFSKMEAGKYEIQTAPFDPSIVLQEVTELLSGRAHDRAIELVYRRDPKVPQIVSGDPDRYRQILNNLVGNAIKFTEEGEIFIEQTIKDSDDESFTIHTMVQDTGAGIAAEDLNKLFNAFTQVDGSMVRRYGGTGLGLAISKRLAEMMGGEIGVTSEVGIGSRFWFTIKTARSEAPIRALLAPLPEGRRALVVEGSRRWCRIIEEHLLAWGLTCDVFQSARPALDKLNEEGQKPYDVAVVGAQLRDTTIESFVKDLRKAKNSAELPLILLTQLGETATLTEVENEVAAQLAKPLRLSELYDCIVGAFSGKKGLHAQPRAATRKLKSRGKKILIVDDNDINQFVATEQVESSGFEVDVADNGQQAVEMVMANQYAAVLMDCQMPVMDGYTAARTIREWESGTGRHIPIIALTAHAMAGERDKVLAAGMDDYLSKPLRVSGLEKMLDRYVTEDRQIEEAPDSHERTANTELCELDPEITRSAKLCKLFLDQVPGSLDLLENSITKAPDETRNHAHKLKGSCLALGADQMAEEAQALQRETESGDHSNAVKRAKTLRAHFERVQKLLLLELEQSQALRPSRISVRP
jgi:signal transduction histidine kinase/CheY-like chemotaxis protein/HPt (histidine-containing phosphotransfer) domain-containing protein